jgi:hypothetical protein
MSPNTEGGGYTLLDETESDTRWTVILNVLRVVCVGVCF